MYQQNLCRIMELILAPMLRSMQTCISQQQLQKQFGHLGNSVYNMQLPSQSSSQPMSELSTSMADLLEIPRPDLTPQPSAVSSMGSQSWDPSASLHLHQSQLLQEQQQQAQSQQVQMQSYSLPASSHRPPLQAAPQHAAQSPSPPSSSQHEDPQNQNAGSPRSVTHRSAYYPSDQGQGSGTQPMNVNIITPAIWQSPQAGTAVSAAQATLSASAPAASTDGLRAHYGSSSLDPSAYLASQHQLQQLPPHSEQQLPQQLSLRPPLATSDSRRSIATNTQLTMHRGNSDAHRSGATQKVLASTATPSGSLGTGSWMQSHPAVMSSNYLPAQSNAALTPASASAQTCLAAQSSGNYLPAQGSACPVSTQVAGQLYTQSQPVLHSSDSAGSLNAQTPVEGLEGRSSGQMPMRAGSPSLGGQVFPKPPSWSSHMHDPFGDLVTSDLKSVGSTHSSTT